MDWFERLTGFVEDGYAEVQQKLEVRGDRLHSLVNGKSYGIGSFEMPSLGELRERVDGTLPGSLKVSIVTGDVRRLHRDPEFDGALFQVASQFNMLEMVGPGVTPEHGVTRYASDRTQGPACAMAAGAATVYRNYLVPCQDGVGQTRDRQLDGLVEMGMDLAELTGLPLSRLWSMRNGYPPQKARRRRNRQDHQAAHPKRRDNLGRQDRGRHGYTGMRPPCRDQQRVGRAVDRRPYRRRWMGGAHCGRRLHRAADAQCARQATCCRRGDDRTGWPGMGGGADERLRWVRRNLPEGAS